MDNNKNWIDQRFPLTKVWNEHLAEYYTPRNFNFWYFFGSLAMLVLVMQIVTGIFLTMHFKPDELKAFASVEYIMRDVNWGWLIRYIHSTGASAFFVVIYLHMYRGLLYGSYKAPRELIWILGMVLYIALMAEAFMGYVLPWGQMSYWGAQVIISLFGSVPLIGPDLLTWILGDYAVGDPALNRFFSLHVIALPLILVILVFLHIVALHTVGSNNPDGVEIKENKDKNGIPKDGIPFHPYYSVKDIVGVVVFLMIFSAVVFFAPAMNGYFLEHANFIEANPLKTPEHIAPLWYLTPFYSVLRAIPPMFGSQFPGVVGMFAALLILLALPWLDRSKVKSIRYRSWPYKVALGVFVISFITLGWLGMEPVNYTNTKLAQVFTVLYFGFFILMPWFTSIGKTKQVPERVTE
ncbi:Ubiquinol--cytochrome c reductase, cytochrome B subunit (EC [uncultured Gammaproteobacteria bacterium]|jgi:ubiquinol-cytochrome c reductase cytochrome b subunit|uniref:cytochrome b n=1 Tax=thiotrophic endosymbiont of Bathymodiolus puteoserpentis (Logatchev) TaxID=343240 RepID=UPI0010B4D946|nr:cytochrome b N-terminal domain-containing protein [thiotrophic endosymbiont of Bathymodiolus puteoserpentis (Logatchev)]CAC9429202.1 Ubiquinol-cytochrome C reductase, cytochrome B subunit (EC 1.10.2.2) [uncultured Gammaproteobacteria bacterium]CAC9431406.1 Ubiquinol-cytochrome C reductase, cytochrome B subunit (EC 1.10.2.2) [uncultured Gammaproteobacteria bacterium]CAC9599933.1 Ubiquinol-cytochrome C reductase, cytochrome B subunit (EC 1.10.2.2) [uncultured Gammaproteobacteria bacterium]CAC9